MAYVAYTIPRTPFEMLHLLAPFVREVEQELPTRKRVTSSANVFNSPNNALLPLALP